ncbi:MAG: carbamoyl-phosphate synthase domain-containing protein, partial [Candidatus Adiutrix sp.]
MTRPPAILMLADGTSFLGEAIGAAGSTGGEVVFNTSMTGYQEILTDPSYTGQLINFTFPHIGNYGTSDDNNEASAPKANGIICAELEEDYGHWHSSSRLTDWLAAHNLSGICGLDTRALTLHLREHGSQNGYISTDLNPKLALEKAQALPSMAGLDLAQSAGVDQHYQFAQGSGPTVAVLDFGVKRSILKQLALAGFTVKVWPGSTSPQTILASGALGVLLSNGPGD